MNQELDAILKKLAGEKDARLKTLEDRLSDNKMKIGGKAHRRQLRRERAAEDAELEKQIGRARTQAKYYEKNKEHLNRLRVIRGRTPKNVYRKARKRAIERGQEWLFSFEEWWSMWSSAPRIKDPRDGFTKPAFECKGGNYLTDTQMCRRDTDGPWSPENCFIALNGEELSDE